MKEYFRRQRIYYRYHPWARLWPVAMVLLAILSGYFQAFVVMLCGSVTLGLTSVCSEAENALPRTQAEVRSERIGRIHAIVLEQTVISAVAYAVHYVFVWATETQQIARMNSLNSYVLYYSVLLARPWFMVMFFALVILTLYDWLLDADAVQASKTQDFNECGRFRIVVHHVTVRGITEGVCEHFPTMVILFFTGVLSLARREFLMRSPILPAILVGAAIVCKVIRIVLRRVEYQPEDFETMEVRTNRQRVGETR